MGSPAWPHRLLITMMAVACLRLSGVDAAVSVPELYHMCRVTAGLSEETMTDKEKSENLGNAYDTQQQRDEAVETALANGKFWIKPGDLVSVKTEIRASGIDYAPKNGLAQDDLIIRQPMGTLSTPNHTLYGKVKTIAWRVPDYKLGMYQAQVELHNPNSAAKCWTTAVKPNDLNPEWNQSFDLECSLSHIQSIEFHLWDADKFGRNEFIGQAALKSNKPRHDATLAVCTQDKKPVVNQELTAETGQPALCKLTVSLETNSSGNAIVRVKNATNVPKMDGAFTGGKADPYVEVKVHFRRTAPCNSFQKSIWVPLDQVTLQDDVTMQEMYDMCRETAGFEKLSLASAYESQKVKDVKDIKWIKKGDHVSFTTKITDRRR